SYQPARLYAIPVKGLYVCEAAGSFRFESTDYGWMIQTVDHKPTPDLDTFIEVVRSIPDRARVVVTYKHLRDLHTLCTSIIHVDRHWQRNMRLAVRNDETGKWDFTDIAEPLPPVPSVPYKANFISLNSSGNTAA